MKKVIKTAEPTGLRDYRQQNPSNTWDEFKRNNNDTVPKKQVQRQLKDDQSGLCAYCEIDFIDKDHIGVADFRVEHFHPKCDNLTSHNWGLDWNNLFGCCHGGSQKNVAQSQYPNRFTTGDHSCDVPKRNRKLDDIILNPLTVPAFPPLFKVARADGKITVHRVNCQSANVSHSKALKTIKELNLDSQRLNGFRKVMLDDLNLKIQQMSLNGQELSDIRQNLAQMMLSKNSDGRWPPFFTSIRSYLGNEAEAHLQQIQYNG